MEQQEKDQILQSARLVEEYENTPTAFIDPYSDMSREELSKLVIYLQQLLEAERKDKECERAEKERERARADEMIAKLDQTNARLDGLMDMVKALTDDKRLLQEKLVEARKTITAKDEQLKLERKNRFGSKSQAGTCKSNAVEHNHQEDKDDFDGTTSSINNAETSQDGNTDTNDIAAERTDRQKMADLLRRGTKYRKAGANRTVTHRSDINRLPEGAELVKIIKRYAYEQQVSIIEHEYELVTYKFNGTLITEYLPAIGESTVIDRVPGTKASADFLAHLSFNHFFLDTPLYREIQRLKDEQMTVSRMTLTNWLHKGSQLLSNIVKCLKETAFEKDAVINCDETWCRVKVYDTYRKRYIWCLVNRERKIAIYCYEDGSRGRDALLSIIEGKELKALQTDGYNVYMYLDNDMVNVEHICCLAHARAKFKYALDQGNDLDAKYILDCIAELYALELTYQQVGLKPDDITIARQSLRTKEIIGRLRSKIDALLSENHPPRGELMEKAIRYIDNYWKQIFAYVNDGRYSIDNNSAERCIRPLAGERKNSLFFGSHKMARASAIYHTIIATCQMQGISILDYLKKFFREIINGNTDYRRLMPQTIGLPTLNTNN